MVKNLEKIDVFWNFVFGGILRGFWEGFGRPKTQYSHFFRCFFDAIFEARFQEAKIRQKIGQNRRKRKVGTWIPVVPPLLGRDLERGG